MDQGRLRLSAMSHFWNSSKRRAWTDGATEPEGFWFTELLTLGMLSSNPSHGNAQEVAMRQRWLRQWGYGEEILNV